MHIYRNVLEKVQADCGAVIMLHFRQSDLLTLYWCVYAPIAAVASNDSENKLLVMRKGNDVIRDHCFGTQLSRVRRVYANRNLFY